MLQRWLPRHVRGRERVSHLDGTPLRSGAQGKRAYGKVPRNRGKNTTLIAVITLEGGMGESVAIEGATDAEASETYVKHFLGPSLEEGQIVVLDGLGAHRSTQRVRELVEGWGAELVLGILLAGCEPYRGSFQQDKAARA